MSASCGTSTETTVRYVFSVKNVRADIESLSEEPNVNKEQVKGELTFLTFQVR